jgi:Zn-dependent protease
VTPDIAQGLVYYIVFLISTTAHEAAHAWAAKRGGDLTAYHGGQVSLNPMPHIRREPFGMVVLPLLSVVMSGWPLGFASAPYDRRWAERYPRRAAWMALAGPGANLLLVALALLAIRGGAAAGVFTPPASISFGHLAESATGGVWTTLATLVGIVLSLNLMLAALNLLPFPPLDGSAAVPLFLDEAGTRRYQAFIWGNPALGWVGILVAWQLFGYVFGPVFGLVADLLYPGVSYG